MVKQESCMRCISRTLKGKRCRNHATCKTKKGELVCSIHQKYVGEVYTTPKKNGIKKSAGKKKAHMLLSAIGVSMKNKKEKEYPAEIKSLMDSYDRWEKSKGSNKYGLGMILGTKLEQVLSKQKLNSDERDILIDTLNLLKSDLTDLS